MNWNLPTGEVLWTPVGDTRPWCCFREVHFRSDVPTTPVFKVGSANLARASPYFRHVLDEASRNPENEGATVMTFTYMNILPGILKIVLWWVETGEILETHNMPDYWAFPIVDDASPWMMMFRAYHAACTFQVLELSNKIIYKIFEMVYATGTVPCETLNAVYFLTKPGDGMRKLMIDLTAYKVPSTVYRIHILSWNLEILQDLLLAVKDAGGTEPYAAGLQRYLTATR